MATPVNFTIKVTPQPDFFLSVSPSSMELHPGNVGVFNVTTAVVGGLTGTLHCAVGTLKPGWAAQFTPADVALGSSTSLRVSVDQTVVPGDFNFTLTPSATTVSLSGS